MLGSLIGVLGDAVKIVAAPIEIAADLTRAVTRPMADAATQVAKDVKESVLDERDRK